MIKKKETCSGSDEQIFEQSLVPDNALRFPIDQAIISANGNGISKLSNFCNNRETMYIFITT